MDDKKVIKKLFSIEAVSVVSDTEDETKGEAAIEYNYKFNTSLPELAYTLSGFLKQIDLDEDIRKTVAADRTPGMAVIDLLQAYYSKGE